jgi:subtilase family serine protease
VAVRSILVAFLAFVTLFVLVPLAPSPSHAADLACANPGYEGFGSATTGGAGATVVAVTNLNDSGPGSLRDALSQGNRCIVFTVSGTIRLQQKLRTGGSNLTIDGLTAPGPGITITPVGLAIDHDNVIVRGLRVAVVSSAAGTQDGIQCAGDNVVIDHVSVRGASDENIGLNGCTNATVSWSILGSPIDGHSTNMLIIGAQTYRVSVHHNLFVDADRRNPWLNQGDIGRSPMQSIQADIRNNLMWDVGGGGSHHGTAVYDGSTANIVNNYYKARVTCAGDPDCQMRMVTVCQASDFAEDRNFCGSRPDAGGVYVAGNFSTEGWSSHLNLKGTRTTPWPAAAVRTSDACTAAADVIAGAGARPLDAADAAYLDSVEAPGCSPTPPPAPDPAPPAPVPAPQTIPDLVITTVSMPGTLAVDTSFPIQFSVVNQGTGSAAATSVGVYLSKDNRVSADDVVLRMRSVTALAAGASQSHALAEVIPAPFTAGSYYVLLAVDPAATVPEANEANNLTAIAVTVTTPSVPTVPEPPPAPSTPDLVITTASVPATIAVNTSFPVTFSVANSGTAPAGATSVGLYLSSDAQVSADDLVLRVRSVTALAAGTSQSHSLAEVIPDTVKPGAYYVLLAVDPAAAVAEANEANNTKVIAVTVNGPAAVPKPDLLSTSVSIPSVVQRNVGFGVKFTAVNRGTAPAAATSTKIYLSRDTRHSSDDVLLRDRSVGALAAGASQSHALTQVIRSTVAAGAYYILLVADSGAAVAEANETNNVTAIAVTVR